MKPRTSRPAAFLAGLPARLRTTLRALVHPRRFAREIDDEIAFHLASRTEDLIRSGLPPREAARQARIEFGAQPTHMHAMRRAFGIEWLSSVAADLAYAARLLRRSKGFTAITVLSLALAIGANTAIFSTANELLFARLDVPHPRQLRTLEWRALHSAPIHMIMNGFINYVGGDMVSNAFPYPAFRALQSQAPGIFGFAGGQRVTAVAHGHAQQVISNLVSGNFFSELGVAAALGRLIQPTDDRVQNGAPLTAVLSYGFWQRHFGGLSSVIGHTLVIDGAPATIIGVTPRGFTGAENVQIAPDVFLPLTAVSWLNPKIGSESKLESSTVGWVGVATRLRPGVSATQLTAHLSTVMRAVTLATTKLSKGESAPGITLVDGSQGDASWISLTLKKPVYVLLGLSMLVLLLACVNVANLMLARSTVRAREMSVRLALGAARHRLFRQLLTESLLLSSLGGAAGLLLAYAARGVVPSLLWDARSEGGSLHIPFNWSVFGFTAAASVLSALISGLAPSWRASRSQPAAVLKQAGAPVTRRRAWSSKTLVGTQLALSTLLVAGSIMFVRTITCIQRVQPGFDTHDLLLFSINLPGHSYPPPNNIATHQRILRALRALPGVQGASLSGLPLLAGYMSNMSIGVEHSIKGLPQRGTAEDLADTNVVSRNYLATMHIPLLEGRTFQASDTPTTAQVAVVTRAFAQRFFGHYNPIGMRFSSDGKAPWTTIIGVSADFHYNSLREPPPAVSMTLYTQQKSMEQATYVIRSGMPPSTLIPELRRAVARIDPNLPLTDIRTQDQQIDELLSQERLFAALSTGFGILALALACAGVYGVFSYAVAGRTREIGIRLALGEPRGRIRAAILREALTLSTLSLVAGLGATLALTTLVRSLLYGVSATDPLSLGATALLLLTVALLAAWLPAARASRVDPMHALRHE